MSPADAYRIIVLANDGIIVNSITAILSQPAAVNVSVCSVYSRYRY